MKVLIAEDDEFLLKVYRMTLEQEEFDVVIAEDGEEALEQAKKEKPDLILLDILMPKKDGFDVLKELKENKDLKDIPVIILSNLGQEADIEKGKALGAVDYIIKGDVDIENVIQKVKKYDRSK